LHEDGVLTSVDSHVNAQTPGAIHEGGELGYVLSVAYGSVMDQPNLISLAVIGDGEAETGPTAAYVPNINKKSYI
jgi:phosphoketolase